MVPVEHVSEDDLERYAMRTLSESGCATLEEHLPFCSGCRDRLQAMDDYVTATRSAAAKISRTQASYEYICRSAWRIPSRFRRMRSWLGLISAARSRYLTPVRRSPMLA